MLKTLLAELRTVFAEEKTLFAAQKFDPLAPPRASLVLRFGPFPLSPHSRSPESPSPLQRNAFVQLGSRSLRRKIDLQRSRYGVFLGEQGLHLG